MRWYKTVGTVMLIGLVVIIMAGILGGGLYIITNTGKRNLEIEQSGYEAAEAGIPPEACQYDRTIYPDARERWLRGWQRYHLNHKTQTKEK